MVVRFGAIIIVLPHVYFFGNKFAHENSKITGMFGMLRASCWGGGVVVASVAVLAGPSRSAAATPGGA